MAGWPNLSELISVAHRNAAVGLLGAPLVAGSVTPGGCDLAPELLRRTLRRIGRYDVETGRELQTLVAISECTSRELLPESYRQKPRDEITRRIRELKILLSEQ